MCGLARGVPIRRNFWASTGQPGRPPANAVGACALAMTAVDILQDRLCCSAFAQLSRRCRRAMKAKEVSMSETLLRVSGLKTYFYTPPAVWPRQW